MKRAAESSLPNTPPWKPGAPSVFNDLVVPSAIKPSAPFEGREAQPDPTRTWFGARLLSRPPEIEFVANKKRRVQANNLPATYQLHPEQEWSDALRPAAPSAWLFRLARECGLPVPLGNPQPTHSWVGSKCNNAHVEPRGSGSFAGSRCVQDLCGVVWSMFSVYAHGITPCRPVCIAPHNKSVSLPMKHIDLSKVTKPFHFDKRRFSGANGRAVSYELKYRQATSVLAQRKGYVFVTGAHPFSESGSIGIHAIRDLIEMERAADADPNFVSKLPEEDKILHPRVSHQIISKDAPVRHPVNIDLARRKMLRLWKQCTSGGGWIQPYDIMNTDEGYMEHVHDTEVGPPDLSSGLPRKHLKIATSDSSARILAPAYTIAASQAMHASRAQLHAQRVAVVTKLRQRGTIA